jgi:Zn-finger protein
MFPKSNAGTLRKNANPTTYHWPCKHVGQNCRPCSVSKCLWRACRDSEIQVWAQQNSGKNIMNMCIYYDLCVFVYILYNICIVTQQPPKRNYRKTTSNPTENGKWIIRFHWCQFLSRPAAWGIMGILTAPSMKSGLLRYSCYPLVN